MTKRTDGRGPYSVLTEACDQAIAAAGEIDDP
ncbi:MAG: hypothetical protein JWN84_2758, partial [Nocardioides sp.]|nr:hypothetical protein [Nocardioides sp.]